MISPKKSFAVFAATPTEKAEWMAHINKCIVDLLAKSKYCTKSFCVYGLAIYTIWKQIRSQHKNMQLSGSLIVMLQPACIVLKPSLLPLTEG